MKHLSDRIRRPGEERVRVRQHDEVAHPRETRETADDDATERVRDKVDARRVCKTRRDVARECGRMFGDRAPRGAIAPVDHAIATPSRGE